MRLSFLGAAETVTGSRFLLETDQSRVLIDCGLFQGLKKLRLQNWNPFPIAPELLDAVLVTHAHIDHSGYLPALVRDGFNGPIWCSPGTADLLELMLLDSAHLQEEDARFANRHRTTKHHPARPLYTTEDAKKALSLIRTSPNHVLFEPSSGVEAEFFRAGHILGSSTIRVAAASASSVRRSVFFTGDVGRPVDPIMQPPEAPPSADYLVTESTYGNRLHAASDVRDDLAAVVCRTLGRGGTVLIPSFAVGRSQAILSVLAELREQGRIPDVPVFLNSPMAISATELFLAHPDEHRLSPQECARLRDGVRFIRTPEESKELTPRRGPMIVVSASGMATGGRILHHLRTVAPDRRSSIVFVGFQAAGTRGEAMVAGASEIKIFGDYIPVHADVVRIDGLSAHADHEELLTWLDSGQLRPSKTFVVHGEASAADALRRRLGDRLGWPAHVPTQGECHDL
jgi:metallo-beta-lactamase family protein